MVITPATPRVSVIIPTYNGDRYLAQAIDSALAQTYRDHEVIVIDDGSTDRTKVILQAYGGRIRAISQKNQGVAIARNHGIAVARGELVAFLDADDVFLPDKLAAQVAVFDTHPWSGMVHSGWQRITASGALLNAVEPWHTVPKLTLENWLRWKPVLPSAMMIRREWLQRSGGFDPRFPPAEDTELVLRLALMGCEADWLRQVTVCYRQHEDSAMHQGLPQARSLAAVIDHFFSHPHLPESIRLLESRTRYNTLVWIAWYLHHTGHPTEMAQVLRQAWAYSPHTPVQTVVHWIDSFAESSRSVGAVLDTYALVQSAEWQQLEHWIWENASCRALA
ncbi:MAG TPA: glycosyltransferase [Crinalium sp.]